MGIDYYSCSYCNSAFPDCSSRCRWCDCGSRFCSPDCAKKEETVNDEGDTVGETCCMCRKEDANDTDLLNFLLKHFNLTHEQAMELYRGKQGDLSSPS